MNGFFFPGGWGKRSNDEYLSELQRNLQHSEDYDNENTRNNNDYDENSLALAKMRFYGNNPDMDAEPLEKRAWRSMNNAWGKRVNDWNKFRGSWGKREPAGGWNNLKGIAHILKCMLQFQ